MTRIRLSEDEAWAVIEQAHTGILTSLRRDGMPIALPVWFVAVDRRIYVSGQTHTKKFVRMRNDPRVSFLVESGIPWVDLVGVHLTGQAQVVTDAALVDRIGTTMHAKYDTFRIPRSDMPDPTRDHYETQVTTVEIVPDDRILSWENARMFRGDD